jgi:hypothetical protein
MHKIYLLLTIKDLSQGNGSSCKCTTDVAEEDIFGCFEAKKKKKGCHHCEILFKVFQWITHVK